MHHLGDRQMDRELQMDWAHQGDTRTGRYKLTARFQKIQPGWGSNRQKQQRDRVKQLSREDRKVAEGVRHTGARGHMGRRARYLEWL